MTTSSHDVPGEPGPSAPEPTPEAAESPAADRPLHDMGGAIGPASIRSNRMPSDPDDPDDGATPRSGFAEPVSPTTGRDEEDPGLAGSDDSGQAAPVGYEVVAGAPSAYIDEGATGDETAGVGADGEYEARLAQKRAGGP